jgi:hypothetical protein
MSFFAEIYLITNKINNKKYIGQAVKTMGKNNKKWGYLNRWKSHIREAYHSKKDNCKALNNAIRKYGVVNFQVEKIEDTTIENTNEKEIYYIKYYNSLVPNGYNLTSGGSRGKDSIITRQRKSISAKKKIISKEAIEKSRLGNIGNRRNKKVRNYEEDRYLPKYIIANRKKGEKEIIAYSVFKYPIGIYHKKYITKRFSIYKKRNKEETLNTALKYLNYLNEEYKDLEKKIINKNIEYGKKI